MKSSQLREMNELELKTKLEKFRSITKFNVSASITAVRRWNATFQN
jgi:hypothetical protein